MSPRRRSSVERQTRALTESAATVAEGLRDLARVPPISRGRPGVVMLMGLPGVGKSHVARLLAPRISAAHVASDDIRSRMFIAPSCTPDESAMVFRVAAELVGSLLSEGHRVIVDATNLRAWLRAGIEATARERQAPLVHVLVTSDEEEALGRLAERRRARASDDHSDADERVYAMLRDRGFEAPTTPFLTARNGPDLDTEIDRVAREIDARLAVILQTPGSA